MSEVQCIQLALNAGAGAHVRVCGTPRSGQFALRLTKPNGRTLSVPLDVDECAALSRILRNCSGVLADQESAQPRPNDGSRKMEIKR